MKRPSRAEDGWTDGRSFGGRVMDANTGRSRPMFPLKEGGGRPIRLKENSENRREKPLTKPGGGVLSTTTEAEFRGHWDRWFHQIQGNWIFRFQNQ